jgi:6-pyruvoyltetrahydropterin/6-carboxytetrahydropterin synthase
MHLSTKTYGPEQGLSACFRQWRADSHCRFLHGYALSIALTFQATTLDSRNWVVDFGGLKPLKEKLQDWFDHKTLVAGDDPELARFMNMHERGLIDLRVMQKGVGCEAFSEHVWQLGHEFLNKQYVPTLLASEIEPPVGLALVSVEVREHTGNSGLYAPQSPIPVTYPKYLKV